MRWDEFQHYKDRDPAWIKNYTRLLADENYLALTLRQRGILHGVWLLYAASGRKLGSSPARLGLMLGDSSVRRRDIERLEQAGFIRVFASTPLALARSREVEEEKDGERLKDFRVKQDSKRTPSRARAREGDEEHETEGLFAHAQEQEQPRSEEGSEWPNYIPKTWD